MQPITYLWLAGGVVGTWFGAELLVRGSARIALTLGIRPMVVGLTVVAFGTSSPEAVVSLVAAAKDSAGIAVGNVFGSNIANVGLILGTVCLLHPVRVLWREVRLDTSFMVLATFVAAAFAMTGHLDRPAGAVMLGMLALSLLYYIRGGHAPGGDTALEAEIPDVPRPGLLWPIAQSVLGLLLLVGGAHLLVSAAEAVALQFGISQEVIGATMVAVGTSLPELAASVVAVVRGHHEIGIGNIIGSNQMNLLFVLGGVCMFGDVEASDQVRQVIVPITLVFTVALIPMMATGGRVGRAEGALLLAGYAAFAAASYF